MPFGKLEGRKLPDLKWWANVVFGLYMLITIPLLCFIIFVMIKGLPRLLATAFDSFTQQLGGFGQAQASGDGLGIAAAVVQMLLLALPILGLAYTLYSLARRLGTALWNWSKPSTTRRLVAGLGSAGVIGLVGYLWAPQLPFGDRQPGPLYAQADFRPIGPQERGTVFDAVGATAPAWLPDGPPPREPRPPPAAAPSPELAPAAVQSPEPTAEGTPDPALTPTVEQSPTAIMTPTSETPPTGVPALVPTAAPAVAPPPLPPAATSAPAIEPTSVPTGAATPAQTSAPTSAPGTTATPAPARPAGSPTPAP